MTSISHRGLGCHNISFHFTNIYMMYVMICYNPILLYWLVFFIPIGSKTLVEDVCEPDVMAENGNYGGGKTHFCQLNSLWSVWYGLLATVLNVYSVLLATRRLSGKTLYIYAVFRYSDVPSMSEILTIWSV